MGKQLLQPRAGVEVVVKKRRVRRTKRIREQRGLSAHKAAVAIGTTAPTIIRHDNGDRTMRYPTLQAYARLLGLSIEEALAFEEDY